MVLAPTGAAAHALDEYVQAARLALTRSGVRLEMDLTPGVHVAVPTIAMLDRDGNGVVTPDEAATYAARVLREILVEVDGERLTMTLTSIDVPPIPELRDGMGTIHVTALGRHHARLGGETRVTFRNDHAPDRAVYLVNALVPDDRGISVVRQERDWSQRSARLVYDIRPGLDVQMSWIVIALATSVGLVLARRVGRSGAATVR